MKNQSYNPYQTAQEQFDKVADAIGLEPSLKDFLRQPMREYHFTIPVKMDDGTVKVFKGFRVQHNDARGPAKGGHPFSSRGDCRYCPRPIHVDDLEMFSG